MVPRRGARDWLGLVLVLVLVFIVVLVLVLVLVLVRALVLVLLLVPVLVLFVDTILHPQLRHLLHQDGDLLHALLLLLCHGAPLANRRT